MKNIKTHILIFLLIVSGTACHFEQEDLFSESAAERLNNSLSEIQRTLTGAPNGWLMEYFTSNEGPGYSMLMSFKPSGEVMIAAKNNLVGNQYTEESSMYSIIADYGPVLTFNTYNKILHLFSNPENPAGRGMGGDYEFIVQQYSNDVIYMLGKKRGTLIILSRLSSNEDWVSYLDQLDKNYNDFFGDDALFFVSGTESMLAYNGTSLIFYFPENIFNEFEEMPFVVTKNGIRFYEPFSIKNNIKVQTFTINNDGTQLVADNSPNTYFTVTALNSYFASSTADFIFDTTRSSNHFTEPLNRIAVQLNEQYNGDRNLNYAAISLKPGFGKSLMLATTPLAIRANYIISAIPKTRTENEITLQKEEGIFDNNGEILYSTINAIDELWGELNGSYIMKGNLSKKEIVFTDASNNSRFFSLKKAKE